MQRSDSRIRRVARPSLADERAEGPGRGTRFLAAGRIAQLMVGFALCGIGISSASEPVKETRSSFEHRGGQFLPGTEEAVTLFPGRPEFAGKFSEESVVRLAYATLEQALIDSGYGARFSLSDFRTYYPRDFAATRIREVITLDSPVVLEITETEVVAPDQALVGRMFSPEWVERFEIEDLPEVDGWLEQFDEITIAASLENPDIDEEHRNLIALTSFAVKASYDGKEIEYRAAFKWMRGGGDAVQFFVEDYVTPAVSQALVAEGEIAPIGVLKGRFFDVDPSNGRQGAQR